MFILLKSAQIIVSRCFLIRNHALQLVKFDFFEFGVSVNPK